MQNKQTLSLPATYIQFNKEYAGTTVNYDSKKTKILEGKSC
jgi:hypothetical protein